MSGASFLTLWAAAAAAAAALLLVQACHYDKIKLKYNYVHPDGWEEAHRALQTTTGFPFTDFKTIKVQVHNAVIRGGMVEGAQVTVQGPARGYGDRYSGYINGVTDAQGQATLGLMPQGVGINVTATKAGFEDYWDHVDLQDSPEDRLISFSMTPILQAGEFQVVMDWGPQPRDLDLHMKIADGHTDKWLHTVYNNVSYCYSQPNNLNCHLNRGPFEANVSKDSNEHEPGKPETLGSETLTVYRTSATAVHFFYVLDFPKKGKNGGSLLTSGATARIQTHGRIVTEIDVPATYDGGGGGGPVTREWLWFLFCVHGNGVGAGNVKVLNSIHPPVRYERGEKKIPDTFENPC